LAIWDLSIFKKIVPAIEKLLILFTGTGIRFNQFKVDDVSARKAAGTHC
jgi:hypothetical protein